MHFAHKPRLSNADSLAARVAERARRKQAGITPNPDKISEKRRQLWLSLNDFATKHGGHITTPPGLTPARLEVLPGSTLPGKLSEVGFDVIFSCEETRVGGLPAPAPKHWRERTTPTAFHTVSVFSVRLPK